MDEFASHGPTKIRNFGRRPLRAPLVAFAQQPTQDSSNCAFASQARPLCREPVSQGNDLWLTLAKICPIHHVARSSKQVVPCSARISCLLRRPPSPWRTWLSHRSRRRRLRRLRLVTTFCSSSSIRSITSTNGRFRYRGGST